MKLGTPALALVLASCPSPRIPDAGLPRVSRSLALSADGRTLWVVNADSDSVSEIDVASRALIREVLLAAAPPARDPSTGRYDPAVRPRAVTIADSLGKVYVAGQAANAVLVVDAATGSVTGEIPVGAEPTAVVASPDGRSVYVVNHESATVQRIDPSTDRVTATVPAGQHPWGASLRADGSALYVTQFLLEPAVTVIDTASLSVQYVQPLPDQPADGTDGQSLLPNGEARAVYAAVARPNDGEIWVLHDLLSNTTSEPNLVFDNTAFPAITRLSPGGWNLDDRLLLRPPTPLTAPGAFTDVISGPRDVAFTPDGRLAFVANAQSEDVMVFDADSGNELGLVRPLPSALIEGIAIDASGTHAYVHGRNTHDVTVLSIAGTGATVDGPPIECLAGADPMPAELRHGQRLFFSSNSALAPITQNFWMACGTCHPEGQTDAITWRFLQGPRDTPSNAGGPIHTGFFFRQAIRNSVLQYDDTIRTEQGGSYDRHDPAQLPDLQALSDFVNYAIPFPQNPNLSPDGTLTPQQAHGQELFGSYCTGCHSGAYFTDSGTGNPSLDLGGPIVLHDVGTCVQSGPFPDQPFPDAEGHLRSPCAFDTPTLRGVFATAPYLHDGSAATLEEAVARMIGGLAATGQLPAGTTLDEAAQADLVAYLKTL
ncbi:MAG: c-type cytochrome [Myxococcales bacterium]